MTVLTECVLQLTRITVSLSLHAIVASSLSLTSSNAEHKILEELGDANQPLSETSFDRAMKLSKGTVSIVDSKGVSWSRVWCGTKPSVQARCVVALSLFAIMCVAHSLASDTLFALWLVGCAFKVLTLHSLSRSRAALWLYVLIGFLFGNT